MQYKYAEIADTVYFWFAANETDGDAGDGANPIYDVRLAGAASDAAPTASGSATLLSHANYGAGLHEIAIDTTGYAAGEYAVFCSLTISAVNPGGFVGSVKLRTAGTGALKVDAVSISGGTGAADNLEAACNNYSVTRGLAGTALPDAAAGSADGVILGSAANKLAVDVSGKVAVPDTQHVIVDSGTVTTLTNKDGFSLSATGADLILKSSTFIQAIVAAINELATYGLTALNTLLTSTGIKTISTAAPDDMALDSTVAKAATALSNATWTDAKAGHLDAAISSRSSHSAADVWSVATRSLTTFGTLVADVVSAVWNAATRTLSAFGFQVTVTANNDKTGYSLSATGADLILKSSTFVQAIVAAINEFATYGLSALNTLLVTTGIKTSSTAAPADMALDSTVAKDATVSKPGIAQTITPPADMALNSTVAKEATVAALNNISSADVTIAVPSAADIKTAMEAAGSSIALIKDVTDAITTASAALLAKSAGTIVSGAAAAGTLSTTAMTTNLTEATDDHYNGRIIIWTSGVLTNQATNITDYDGATKKLTYTAITEAPTALDTFIIV